MSIRVCHKIKQDSDEEVGVNLVPHEVLTMILVGHSNCCDSHFGSIPIGLHDISIPIRFLPSTIAPAESPRSTST